MGRVGQLTQLQHCDGQIETLGSMVGKVGRVSCLLCELQECIKPFLDMDGETVMKWAKRRLTNIGGFMVGVCYTPPDQDVIVMKPSSGNWEHGYFCWLWSSWVT